MYNIGGKHSLNVMPNATVHVEPRVNFTLGTAFNDSQRFQGNVSQLATKSVISCKFFFFAWLF